MKLNKVVSGMIIGGLLLTAGSISMASASDLPGKFVRMVGFHQDGQHPGLPGLSQPGLASDTMKEVMDQLVSDGTLTQDQVDKFQAYIDETVKNAEQNEKGKRDNKPDFLTDAVDKGIITQEQADIIVNKIKEKGQEIRQEKIKTQLSSLVTSGTITQEQADKMLQAFEEKAAKQQETFAKIKDMTPEEKQSYMKSLKEENINPLSQLVTDGTITQEQSDSIAKSMPRMGGHLKLKDNKGNFERKDIKPDLSSLVTGGTITQEQADKVLQAFEEKAAKQQETFAKIKDMTQEEKQSYMQSLKEENIHPLSQMVSEGTITQEQADAIAKLMPHRGGPFKLNGGKGDINNDVAE